MYKIENGKIHRGVDTIAKQVLVTQLNEIEGMLTRHDVPDLSSKMRLIADLFDQKDAKIGNDNQEVQESLHLAANLLSAINREVMV
jgi:hypothetical protein